jgi:peptidoglycan/xylan/chitin deacetylase (PgdA/CDA1 family)
VDPRKPHERKRGHLSRGLRFVVAGIICWALLIAAAVAVVKIKDGEEAAARRPFPAPKVVLAPRMKYMWSHFPKFHDVVPVLAYHGVNTEENYLSVTRKRFAEQMLALKTAGFHTVTIGQYAKYVATGSTAGLPKNPILLTFDDGRLDSFRGADQILAHYGDVATIFVVAAWPEERPGWALHWSELAKMEESGRWDVQEHAGDGHHHILVSPDGKHGEFYAYLGWHSGTGLESFGEYKKRVTTDVEWGEEMLHEHIPGYKPLAFAVPYSNYGQRFTNDPQIPEFFLHFLHTQFPVVIDGDYLDEGKHRPFEVKGRGDSAVSYRITQGPADSLPVLACRLRDFVLKVPMWHEYACLEGIGGSAPSAAYSD